MGAHQFIEAASRAGQAANQTNNWQAPLQFAPELLHDFDKAPEHSDDLDAAVYLTESGSIDDSEHELSARLSCWTVRGALRAEYREGG